MSENKEGEFKRQLAQLLASKRETPNGVTLQASIDISLALVDKALQDFPFHVYFDNVVGGENHYSFHLKNKPESYPSNTDEITREVAEWLERWFFGVKKKTGLYLVNRDKTKTEKKL